jgi:hypothetical protein
MSRPPTLNYSHVPKRDDLRAIATRQKVIILCILCNLAIVATNLGLNAAGAAPGLRLLLALIYLGVGITALVFVFMLSLALYNVGVGILLGLLMFIPLVNLIVLLTINGKATKVLRENGINVGLLGASTSEIP